MFRFSVLLCLASYLLSGTNARLIAEGIIGGNEATPDEYTYQVYLLPRMCGGAIIGDQYILTAAHCVTDGNGIFDIFSIHVLAGVFDRAHKGNDAVKVDVEKIYIPSEYKGNGQVGDIAVLKLVEPLDLNNHKQLSKVELPDSDESYAGKEATITGYGWANVTVHPNNTETGRFVTTKKKFAIADVLKNADCQKIYTQSGSKDIIDHRQICARVHQRHLGKTEGVCAGDSGGPLVYKNRVVIGVLSTSPRGCNEAIAPAIYTRVSTYMDLINNALADRVTNSMRVCNVLDKCN